MALLTCLPVAKQAAIRRQGLSGLPFCSLSHIGTVLLTFGRDEDESRT